MCPFRAGMILRGHNANLKDEQENRHVEELVVCGVSDWSAYVQECWNGTLAEHPHLKAGLTKNPKITYAAMQRIYWLPWIKIINSYWVPSKVVALCIYEVEVKGSMALLRALLSWERVGQVVVQRFGFPWLPWDPCSFQDVWCHRGLTSTRSARKESRTQQLLKRNFYKWNLQVVPLIWEQ